MRRLHRTNPKVRWSCCTSRGLDRLLEGGHGRAPRKGSVHRTKVAVMVSTQHTSCRLSLQSMDQGIHEAVSRPRCSAVDTAVALAAGLVEGAANSLPMDCNTGVRTV